MTNLLSLAPLLNLFGRQHVPSILEFNKSLATNFEYPPYEVYKLDKTPSTSTELTKDDAILYYTQMQRIRRMEQTLANLYKDKSVRGFCHLYSGQEAVAVGIKSVMRPQDTAITSYRCHGWMILMDATFQDVIAELLGKATGTTKGKGGSMHMYRKNFFGGNGIVAAQVPLGTGVALKHKYTNDGGICVTLYGDGASNQGQCFEAFNMAKLLSLPVLYVIENNRYSMGTPIPRHASNHEMYKRGDYIPGIRLDGMDILAVREGAKFCFEYITSGKGPLLLEVLTYRYFGHSMSDPGTSYRTRDEVKQIRETRDPIKLLETKIVEAKLVTQDELKKIEATIKTDVDSAVKKAKADKELAVEEAAYDVYSNFKGLIRMPALNHYIEHKTGKR